jgi:hypothetical protein
LTSISSPHHRTSDLPTNLRAEVHGFTRGEVLSKVALFEGCETGFLNELADRLKPRIYAPGDHVIDAGDKGEEMFFLNRVSVHASPFS